MGLEEQVSKYMRGKQVIIVTSALDSEGYLQEIAGTLLEAVDGCLVIEQDQELAPTLVNPAHVTWIYEDSSDEDSSDDDSSDDEYEDDEHQSV